MLEYIFGRLVQMIFVLFVISFVVFVLLRLIPGDSATSQLGLEAGDQAYKELRIEMGLEDPLYIQYLTWFRNVIKGELGVSWSSKKSASELIKRRLPATISLTVMAILIALMISIPIGVYSGIRPNSIIAHFATFFSMIGIALPSFWLGLMLILIFSVKYKFFPPSGYESLFVNPLNGLKHLILPSFTLGFEIAAPLTRFIRSAMIEVMKEDYIRTARSKGLLEYIVISRHAIKNSMISVITVFGMFVGYLLSGSIITESVFNYPGIGTLLIQSINQRDYGIIQGIILLVSMIFMIVNLIIDISYAYIDPRIRYKK